MPKITMDQAIEFADSQKYEGDRTPAGLQKYFKSLTDWDATIDGKNVSLSECEIEEAAAKQDRKAYSFGSTTRAANVAANTGNAAGGFDDDQIKAKVDALLSAKMESMGLRLVNGRPTLVDPNAKTVSVKGWDERWYDDQIKTGKARFQSYEQAMLFRHCMAARIGMWTNQPQVTAEHTKAFHEKAEQIHGKAYGTQSITGGAALVPEVFRPDLIKNVLEYGVYGQLTQVYNTNQPKIVLPRRTGGLTAYWPAEGTAPTTSQATYDNVVLDAETVMVECIAPMQLLNDSGIMFSDQTMQEMALQLAQIKDQCLLTADGSPTYGRMTGFDKKFGTVATDGGYVVAGGDSSDGHTQKQLALCIARLPQYAIRNAKWTCSQAVYGATFAQLSTSTAVTALTQGNLANSFFLNQFLGFPIVVNNVMNSNINLNATKYYPTWTAGDAPDILFGDFTRASKCLDLMDVDLAMSTERGFDTYSMYYRAVARFDFNVHDVGTSSAAGPVVSFWQT